MSSQLSVRKEMNPAENQLRLPRVDFSALSLELAATPEWAAVRGEVMQALETFGSFELVYTRVSPQLREAIFKDATRDVFGLPLEARSQTPGFLGKHIADAVDSVIVLDVSPAGFDSFARLLWPQRGNSAFCEMGWSYAKESRELDQMIQKMIMETLGIEKQYDHLVQHTAYSLRLSSYEAPPASSHEEEEEEEELVFAAHTDPSLLAMIAQHQLNGLEVQIKTGEWIRPNASKDSFIVLPAESMEAWTNGRVQATRHRVMMSRGKRGIRYSVIFSSAPKEGFVLQAPAEMVDDMHPKLYNPFDFAEFMRFRYTFRGQDALKHYCGVGLQEEAHASER